MPRLDAAYPALSVSRPLAICFFLFHGPPPTGSSTLSLHDALPISSVGRRKSDSWIRPLLSRKEFSRWVLHSQNATACKDRKSTRLNSSHSQISYAVFCLKKKNIGPTPRPATRSIAEFAAVANALE